jgi:predicted nucleotidyltransferase component of viral defense system
MAGVGREFFERLISLGRPKRRDIVEKDYHLQRLLHEFAKEDWLRENLLFKGGTCLIKAYLDYHRFSEDLDFTWRDQSFWATGSKTKGRKHCETMITELVNRTRDVSQKIGLVFKGDKKDAKEVHIHTGARMLTMTASYNSEVLGIPSSIKIEVGFAELLVFPPQVRHLRSYAEGFNVRELSLLYPEHLKNYFDEVKLPCYDVKEIYLEKCRAAMTRLPSKMRDLVDIYYIQKKFNLDLDEYVSQITDKTLFSLDQFGKFIGDISKPNIIRDEDFRGEELALLISDPPKGLLEELKHINDRLMALKQEILRGRRKINGKKNSNDTDREQRRPA